MNAMHPMPEMRADADLINRALHRHDLTQQDVVRGTCLGHSYISRMVAGQYPVHALVLRWLYQRTGDAEIRDFLLGEGEHVTVTLPERERSDPHDLIRIASAATNEAIGAALQTLRTTVPADPAARDRVCASVDAAVAALLRLRRQARPGKRTEAVA